MTISQHATTYGFETGQVGIIRMELEHLKSVGIPLEVRVRGMTMFQAKTTWEELGIPGKDRRALRLTKGSKRFFAPERINPLQSLVVQIRMNLLAHSYDITGFRPYRYVYAGTFPEWKSNHDRLVLEFNRAVIALLECYDQDKQRFTEEFVEIAHEAYEAIKARDLEMAEPEDAFVNRVVDAALATFPRPEAIRQKLTVSVRTAILEDSRDVEKAKLELDQVHAERLRVKQGQDEFSAAQAYRLEVAKRQIEEMTSPFQEALRQLEQQIYQTAVELEKVISRQGFVPGRSAKKARGLKQMYELMAVVKNPDTEAALEGLEKALTMRPAIHITHPIEAAALAAAGRQRISVNPQRNHRYNTQEVSQALERLVAITRSAADALIEDAHAGEFDGLGSPADEKRIPAQVRIARELDDMVFDTDE